MPPTAAQGRRLDPRRATATTLAAAFALALGTATAAEPTAAPESLAQLDQRLTELVEQHDVPAAAYAVWLADGQRVSRGFGHADLAGTQPVDGTTLFRVGSVSKSFVALAVLKLAEEGRLALDGKLHELAREVPFDNPWQATDPITVEMLLEHTAGFDDMHFRNMYNRDDPAELSMHDVVQRLAPELRVRWRPGSRHAYSNPGYAVAGFLIEKTLRQPFEDALAERVLKPLGLASTSARLTPALERRVARARDRGGAPVPLTPIYLRPAGSVVSSADDLLTVARWLALRGAEQPLLSAGSILRMETSLTGLGPGAGLEAGYALGNFTSERGGVIFHGHDGGIDGYLARYAYAPDRRVAYVWLQASESGAAARAARNLLADFVVRDAPAAEPEPGRAGIPEDAAGYWRPANPRHALLAFVEGTFGVARSRIDGARLELAPVFSGQGQTLVHVGHGRFRLDRQRHTRAVLTHDDDGTPLLWSADYVLRRSGALAALAPALGVVTALLLVLSGVAFALLWVPQLLVGRLPVPRHWLHRLLPLATGVVLFGALGATLLLRLATLGAPTLAARVVELATLAFAALAPATLVVALLPWRGLPRGLRWHALLVGVAGSALAAWFAAHGLIGVRLWQL